MGAPTFSGVPLFWFWEPAHSFPAYLQLCLQSWRHIKGVDIIALDYGSLGRYLAKPLPEAMHTYSKAQQANAIRLAVLAEHGGLWLDTDTIAFRDPTAVWDALNDNDVVLFGNPGQNAFNNFIAVRDRDDDFIRSTSEAALSLIAAPKPADAEWDCTSRYFYDRVARQQFGTSKVITLDLRTHGYIAEVCVGGLPYNSDSYRKFWFDEALEFSPSMLDGNCGVIGLHHSWTPDTYRWLSAGEVLAGKETKSKFIRYALSMLA